MADKDRWWKRERCQHALMMIKIAIPSFMLWGEPLVIKIMHTNWDEKVNSKVGDHSQGQPEGSLFNSYYTEV